MVFGFRAIGISDIHAGEESLRVMGVGGGVTRSRAVVQEPWTSDAYLPTSGKML